MDISIFFGLVTVVAFISAIAFGIYQYKQAKDSDKNLEQARENIKELEEGLLLSDYKLRKAVEFYEEGHYKNSLEVFKKYISESEDVAEFRSAIKKIFWKETRKIYSKNMGSGWSPNIVIMTILTKEDNDSAYPDFINELLDIYEEHSGKKHSAFLIPVLLNQNKYAEVIDNVKTYRALPSNNKANEEFRKFIVTYCERQLEET